MKREIALAVALTLLLALPAMAARPDASSTKQANTAAATVTKGDINDDGQLDATDVSAMLELTLSGLGSEQSEVMARSDINGDGSLDATDVSALLEMVLTGDLAPEAPAGLTATALADMVKLQWDATAGAQSYNIYRSADGVTFERIASTTATAYVDLAPLAGVSYYAVAAIAGGIEGARSEAVRYPAGEEVVYNPETDIMIVYNVVSTTERTRIYTNVDNNAEYEFTQYIDALYIDGAKYTEALPAEKNFGWTFATTGRHVAIIRLKSSCTKIGYWTGWLNGNSDYNGEIDSGGYAVELHFPSQITYYKEGTGIEDWYVTDIYSYRKEAATSGFGWIWRSTGTRNSIGMNVVGTKRLHVPQGATGYGTSGVWTPLTSALGYELVYDL